MANELKPCPFCGAAAEMQPWHGGAPTKQLVSCSDDQCDVSPSVTGETPEEASNRWNTRPAAPVEGLETVSRQYRWGGDPKWKSFGPIFDDEPKETRELVTRSQAEAIIAAERAENDEAYDLGKRDGYSEAVQQIDLKTGGDGEYRYCTDHDPDRHTPDPASMILRIVERFETLNTIESISEINEWKRRANEAEAENSALTARVKELEETVRDDIRFAKALETNLSSLTEQLKKVVAAWESLPGGRNYSVSVMQEWISGPMKKAIDNVRAALEGKP